MFSSVILQRDRFVRSTREVSTEGWISGYNTSMILCERPADATTYIKIIVDVGIIVIMNTLREFLHD